MSTTPQRMTWTLFESLVWSSARLLASPEKAERDAGMAAVRTAWDTPRRGVRARGPGPALASLAEAARCHAQAVNGDLPHVTRARRDVLAQALDQPAGDPEAARAAAQGLNRDWPEVTAARRRVLLGGLAGRDPAPRRRHLRAVA